MNVLVIGIVCIALFSATAIVLFIILFDSIRNKRPLGRQIPLPPKKIRDYAHNRPSRNK
jgi:hypothetical protein